MYRNTAYGEIISDSNIKYDGFDIKNIAGTDYILDKFIEGDLTVLNSNVAILKTDPFSGKRYDVVNFPELIRIDMLQSIGYTCYINELYAPKLTYGLFDSIYGLKHLDLPSYIGPGEFYRFYDTESVYLPLMETMVRGYAFTNWRSLKHIYLPSCTSTVDRPDGYHNTYNNTFEYCSELQTVNLPIFITTDLTEFFYYCQNLQLVDFGSLPSMVCNTGTFYNCAKLTTLIIRTSSLCTLNTINAFNRTPFASGNAGGTLYVPQSLISSYQNATNWKTILGYPNNKILPLEGSPYETPSTSYDHY